MEVIPITLSSGLGNSDDFTVTLSQPLNLIGQWRCKIKSLHFTLIQYVGQDPRNVPSPFILLADFVEETEVNGSQATALCVFTPNGIKQNLKKPTHKKQSIEFSEDYHPLVMKNYISRIRLRILDRSFEKPMSSDRPLFSFGTTCMLLLIRDG